MKIYIATQHQATARPVRDALVAAGHRVTASWIDAEGYASIPHDAVSRYVAAMICDQEIRDSDALLVISEPDAALTRGGKHVETGLALARGKRVFLLGKPENVFHWHAGVGRVETIGELIEGFLKETKC